MPVSIVFLFLTGLSIFAWVVLFGIAITDSDDQRVNGYYSYMTAAVGVFYTSTDVLVQILARFS